MTRLPFDDAGCERLLQMVREHRDPTLRQRVVGWWWLAYGWVRRWTR